MKYLITGILLILILLNFNTKERTSMRLTPNDSILAFGDSLTYGFGANPGEDYPSLLSEMSGLKVINAGVNGDTSSEGLRRLAPLLQEPSVKLMILFFGGNDILQREPMPRLKANLKRMIALAKAKEIDVLLVAVPDIGIFGLSPLDLYEEVAEEEKTPLLSGMLSDILSDPSLKSDQIHPNAKGYRVMAERIFESLKQYGWLP